MPILLAGLGDMVFALLCIALAASIYTFGRFLAQLIPNLPVIGSKLRDAVTSLADSAGGWLVDQTKSSWSRLSGLFIDLGYGDRWIAQHTVDAIGHALDLVSHVSSVALTDATNLQHNIDGVVTNTIPTAIATAVGNVEYDIASSATSLQHNIDRVVTTDIPTAVSDAVTTVEGDLSHTAMSLQNNIDRLTNDVTSALALVWNAISPLQYEVGSTIPAEIQAQATSQAAATAAEAKARIDSLSTTATNLQNNIDAANAKAASALAASATAQSNAEAADLTTAEGVAYADQQAAESSAQLGIAAQATKDAANLQDAVGALQGQIVTLQATQTITLPALPDVSIPGTISVPIAVGALATAVASIATEIERCMVTACEGPNNWQSLLQDALGVASFAEIAEFLASAVKDPKGEAAALSAVASDTYTTAHGLFDDLLSL